MTKKQSITFSDINEVTLGSSAVFETQVLKKCQKSRKQVPDIPVETRGFPSPSLNGFGFVEDWK